MTTPDHLSGQLTGAINNLVGELVKPPSTGMVRAKQASKTRKHEQYYKEAQVYREVTEPKQLKMFMTPREIMGEYAPPMGDLAPGESDEHLWQRKLSEAQMGSELNARRVAGHRNRTLAQSIAEEGVHDPVQLTEHIGRKGIPGREGVSVSGKPMVGGGSHRIAAANAADPDSFVPVLHFEDIRDAQGYYDIPGEPKHNPWGYY